MTPFHLAFPVFNLEHTHHFYGTIIGCTKGRSATRWIDFDFFGHQISAHLVETPIKQSQKNQVDGDQIPTRHFGVILEWTQWASLHKRFAEHDIPFRVSPKIRFEGTPGEQGTFFVDDPSGNSLEFKTFRDHKQIFATTVPTTVPTS
jgi:extradiol dioxygenase family protein